MTVRPPFAMFLTWRWAFPHLGDPFGRRACLDFPFIYWLFPEKCDWFTWDDYVPPRAPIPNRHDPPGWYDQWSKPQFT